MTTYILTPAQQQAVDALETFAALDPQAPTTDVALALVALQAAEDSLHSTYMWFTTYASNVAAAIRKAQALLA